MILAHDHQLSRVFCAVSFFALICSDQSPVAAENTSALNNKGTKNLVEIHVF